MKQVGKWLSVIDLCPLLGIHKLIVVNGYDEEETQEDGTVPIVA
jgi:hypothetical protein